MSNRAVSVRRRPRERVAANRVFFSLARNGAQIRTILEQSADDLGKPGNDDFYGLGRVNALRAVLQW